MQSLKLVRNNSYRKKKILHTDQRTMCVLFHGYKSKIQILSVLYIHSLSCKKIQTFYLTSVGEDRFLNV